MDHTKTVVFLFVVLGIVAPVTSIKKFHPKLSRDAKVKVSLFILCFSCNFSLSHQKFVIFRNQDTHFLHISLLLAEVSHGKRRRRGKRERPLPASDAFCITLELAVPKQLVMSF